MTFTMFVAYFHNYILLSTRLYFATYIHILYDVCIFNILYVLFSNLCPVFYVLVSHLG